MLRVETISCTALMIIALALPDVVHAGDCMDDSKEYMARIEQHSRSKRAPDDTSVWGGPDYAMYCLLKDAPRFKSRIEAACRKIIDREGTKHNGCMKLSAAAGITMLGKHDVFAWVTDEMEETPLHKFETRASSLIKPDLYARMADPRGRQIVLDIWKTWIPRAKAEERDDSSRRRWSVWRQRAAAALGVLGGADERAFLVEQEAISRDRYVARACQKAIAAIDQRLKRSAP